MNRADLVDRLHALGCYLDGQQLDPEGMGHLQTVSLAVAELERLHQQRDDTTLRSRRVPPDQPHGMSRAREEPGRVRLDDLTATQALWNLQLRAQLLVRYSARPVVDFHEAQLGQLHPVDTPHGPMVLGYELDEDDQPRDELREVNTVVDRHLAGWALADWWATYSGWLEAVPLEAIEAGQHARVLEAATRMVVAWEENR